MKKIYIIHENHNWMIPIKNALDQNAIEYIEWDMSDSGLLDLDTVAPDGIFFNRMSPSSHSRGHQYSVYYTLALLSWIERYNRVVINGSSVMQMEISKIAQYHALNNFSITTPKTIAAFSKNDIVTAADQIGFPLILKHNWGGRGLGVRKFTTLQTLNNYLTSDEFEWSIDGIYLVQKFIISNNPYIIRAEFINGEFIYGVKINVQDSYNLCPADSCSIEGNFCTAESKNNNFNIIKELDNNIIQNYKKFLKKYNIQIAGIEFIEGINGNIYTYDVNANTNYNSQAEKNAGVSAYEYLAHYLKNLASS